MLTLLPHPNFTCSAMALRDEDLLLARRHANIIQATLQDEAGHVRMPIHIPVPMGWSHHPAVRMWDGYVVALMLYRDCMIREAHRRGHVVEIPLMLCTNPDEQLPPFCASIEMPPWLGDERVHDSHQAYLATSEESMIHWPVSGRGEYGLAISGGTDVVR